MSIIPKGTPVTYTTVNSQICPGLAADDNGVDSHILYFDGAWNVSNPVATRDDTQTTPNSWAPVMITSQFKGV